MKLLNILHTESSLGWGGQEIRILNESLGMSKRGHRIFIASPGKSMIYSKARDFNITLFPLSFKKKILRISWRLLHLSEKIK